MRATQQRLSHNYIIYLSKPWRNRSITFLVDKSPHPLMPQVRICVISCRFVPTNHSQSFLFLSPGILHPSTHVKKNQRNNKKNASFKLMTINKYSILSLSLQLRSCRIYIEAASAFVNQSGKIFPSFPGFKFTWSSEVPRRARCVESWISKTPENWELYTKGVWEFGSPGCTGPVLRKARHIVAPWDYIRKGVSEF